MNRRLLLALACILTLAGWLVSTAAACHSEIAGSIDCQGSVSYTATAWNGSDATSRSRTNPDVRVWASADNGSTWTEIAKNHFGSDNGFTFSGTYAAGSATVVWLKVQEVAKWGNGDAPAAARLTKLTKNCSSTPPPNCAAQVGPNGAVTNSHLTIMADNRAHETFTVAAGCKDIELTLVSYKAPGPTFDERTADQQVVFDYKTGLFSAGTYDLEIGYADCYFQVDFVYGKRIEKFGPAGTNNFYWKQGRRIDTFHGGTKACTETNTPPTTTTPPTTNTPPTTITPVTPAAVTPAVVPAPSVSLVKTERVGTTGAFVRGPVRGKVGQRVFYNLTVTNTGTATINATVKDPGCDAGTLKPVGAALLNPGASFTFHCSHLLRARDGGSYTNVAVATGTASNGAQATATSQVVARVVAGEVLGTQKTVKKQAAKPKVKKVTKKAKPAKPVVVAASFTG
ncbi:MAG: hypothetical protein QOF45_280 [Gaiellaceae bacterium]|nr:hypothetical protein [Gaiellaceae bacterium]